MFENRIAEEKFPLFQQVQNISSFWITKYLQTTFQKLFWNSIVSFLYSHCSWYSANNSYPNERAVSKLWAKTRVWIVQCYKHSSWNYVQVIGYFKNKLYGGFAFWNFYNSCMWAVSGC